MSIRRQRPAARKPFAAQQDGTHALGLRAGYAGGSRATGDRSAVRPPAVTHALGELRRWILSGAFGPAGVLPSENDLAQRLSVSRRIVREAIRGLEVQGLLQVAQGQRTRVRPPDPAASIQALEALLVRSGASVEHLMEVRLLLEPQFAALASERASDADLQKMENAVDDLDRARTFDQIVEADDAFHFRLAEAAGNPVFSPLLRTLFLLLEEARRADIARGNVEFALNGHRAILAAIRARDAQTARSAMVQHIVGIQKDGAASTGRAKPRR